MWLLGRWHVGVRQYNSNMRSSSREEIVERIGAFRDGVSGLLELSFDVLTTPERLAVLEQIEQEVRRAADTVP